VFRRSTGSGANSEQIVAANIDTVFVCDALDASLTIRHLERFLALAFQSGATPVVVITKSDSVTPAAAAEAVEAVKAVGEGGSVVVVSSTTGEGISNIAPLLIPGRTVALLGLSGAGKSTLANLLAGSDILATGAVRRDGTGRHTTTHRQPVVLPGGSLLIDTPGMRALSVLGAAEGVEQAFNDVGELAVDCRFTDCSHSGEQGCAIAEAIAGGHLDARRLESWLALRAEPTSSHLDAARRGVAERKLRKATKFAERRDAKASPPEPDSAGSGQAQPRLRCDAACSRSRRARLVCNPPAYPLRAPSAPITR
jgi:ribosome biogenesis GTPase